MDRAVPGEKVIIQGQACVLTVAQSRDRSFLSLRYLFLLLGLLGSLVGVDAVSHADEAIQNPKVFKHDFAGDPARTKSIFVFLDGTSNDKNSATNVWKLYQSITKNNDPQMTAYYIEGVGTARKPIIMAALGLGQEARILRGYEFIMQEYRPGDKVYLFGFSRGAHEARALAGLIAYAGVPSGNNQARPIGNKILELIQEKEDEDYVDAWKSWKVGDLPLLANEIREELNVSVQSAEVDFLGVWDTVPGSSFKTYTGGCKEDIGWLKRNLYWLPWIDRGERYKTGTYPPIRHLAHALAIDEKRSKFAPNFLCAPISDYSKIEEVWFPGAHADVGGGYKDSDGLPGLSLNWMIDLLTGVYKFNEPIPHEVEDPNGLAHWSYGDIPAIAAGECKDRTVPSNAVLHPSINLRKQSPQERIVVNDSPTKRDYPTRCPPRN